MMLSALAFIPLALVVQGSANGSGAQQRMETVTDRMVDYLLDRPVRRLSPLQRADLDNAALGKATQLAVPRSASRGASSSEPARIISSGHPGTFALKLVPRERSLRLLHSRPGAGERGFEAADFARPNLQVPSAKGHDAIYDIGESSNVKVVHSEADLEDVIMRAPGLVVLEVDDVPLETSGPKYERLAINYDKVKFLRIADKENESTHRVIAERFNVKSTPSFYCILNGKIVAEQEGGNVDELRSRLSLNFLSVDLMSA